VKIHRQIESKFTSEWKRVLQAIQNSPNRYNLLSKCIKFTCKEDKLKWEDEILEEMVLDAANNLYSEKENNDDKRDVIMFSFQLPSESSEYFYYRKIRKIAF
jgi:hypothetical protein